MGKGNRKGSKASLEETVSVIDEAEETMNASDVELAEEAVDVAAEQVEASASEVDALEALDDSEDDASDSEGKVRKFRGKRQAFYDCAANVTLIADLPSRNLKAGDMALIMDPVSVTMPGEEVEFDRAKTRTEAISIFTARYGVEPELINGPIYNMKGIVSAPRKRETINVTVAKEAPFTAERGKAVHRFKDLDWNVLVNFTERKDTVFVFYETLVDPKIAPKDKSKFQKPTPKFLPITAIRDLQKNVASA